MSKFVDAIIGHAIGDAMGVPTEFCHRENLLENPITKMISSDKVGQPAGTWSDDTSMEIATINSFIDNVSFDYDDIMRRWTEWIEKGRYACNDVVFDVGRTCLSAIKNYNDGINPLECGLDNINANGNGSLMRILPVALYSYYKKLNNEEIIKLTCELSSLTHRHEISKLGCLIYVKYIIYLLNGLTKEEAYKKIQEDDYSYFSDEAIGVYNRILKNNIKDYYMEDINSSGYVVDTLECSLWIILNSNSYKEAIIASTNIGQDTDTIGAVTGSIAGIIYGFSAIPNEWINDLIKKDYLIDLALNFEKKVISLKKDVLLGAVIGDVVGSRFEISNNKSGKEFAFFAPNCRFTDDSVMTLAIAQAFTNCKNDFSDIKEQSLNSMVELGRKYYNCGFGRGFYNWIMSNDHLPYGSYGNGAAMRISPVGVAIKNIDDIKNISAIITNVSHNHQDSVLGSTIVSIVINLALTGNNKDTIKKYIEDNYFNIHDLKNNFDDKKFHINCLETVKESLIAFFESIDFEDTIRNAISFGGDSDTIAAIAGSMAAAYYGIPNDLCERVLSYLDDYLIEIHDNFYKKYGLEN